MDYVQAINCFIAYQRIRIATLSFTANILIILVIQPIHQFRNPSVVQQSNLPLVWILFKIKSDKHPSSFRQIDIPLITKRIA